MSQESKTAGKKAKVIADFNSEYSDPLIVREGDLLNIKEKSLEWPGWIYCINQHAQKGWVPESYINITGEFGVVLCPYNAAELNVRIGDQLMVAQEESGWCWCMNEGGEKGWVPAKNLEFEE